MSRVHMQAIDKTHSSHDVEKALLIIQDNIIKGFEREHARLIPRLYPIKSGTRGGSNAHNISLRKSPRLNSRLVSPMTTDLSQFGSVFSRNLHTSGSAGSNSNIGTHSTHLKPGTPAISAWMLPPSTTTSNIPPNNSRTRSAHTPHWERLYSAHTSKVKQRELLANVAEEQRRLAEERSCTFKPNVSPLRMHSKSAEPFTVGRSTAVHQRLFVDAKRLKVRSPGRYESESAENCTNQWASSLRGVASKAKRISEGRERSNNEHHRSNSKLRTKKSSQNLIGGGSIIVHRTADAWGRLFDEAKDRAERKKAKDKGPEESTSTSTKQISKKDTDALVYRLVRDVQSREQRLQERREAVEKRREEALRRDMYAARCKTPQRSHSAFRKHPPHSAHPDASNRSKTEVTFDYGSNAVKDNNFAVPPEFDMNFNDEDADWNLIKDLSFGNRHDLPSSRLDLTEDSPRTLNDRDILNVDESKTSVPVKTTIPPVIPTLRLPSRLPDLSILDSNNQMSTDTEKASEDVGTYDYMEYFEHFSKEENALPH